MHGSDCNGTRIKLYNKLGINSKDDNFDTKIVFFFPCSCDLQLSVIYYSIIFFLYMYSK